MAGGLGLREHGPVHTWCYHWSEAAFTVAVSQFKPPMRCSSKAFIFIRRAPRPSVKGALLLQRRLHEMIQRLMPCSGPVGATVHCLHNILYEPNCGFHHGEPSNLWPVIDLGFVLRVCTPSVSVILIQTENPEFILTGVLGSFIIIHERAAGPQRAIWSAAVFSHW